MSTKTTFKRVALATVAAMGFGLLSVVPASAGASATTLTFTLGAAPTAKPARGAAVVIPINVALSGTADAIATGTLKAELTSKPTNSALNQYTAVSVDNTVHAAAGGARYNCAKIAWALRSPRDNGNLYPSAR